MEDFVLCGGRGSGSLETPQYIGLTHGFVLPFRQLHILPNTPDRNGADVPDPDQVHVPYVRAETVGECAVRAETVTGPLGWLVPNQLLERIRVLLESHCARHGPAGVRRVHR